MVSTILRSASEFVLFLAAPCALEPCSVGHGVRGVARVGQKMAASLSKGLVNQTLSFEQFVLHMQHQAHAQERLRSLQERRYRTARFATP